MKWLTLLLILLLPTAAPAQELTDMQRLSKAILTKNVSQVRELLEESPDLLDQANDSGVTPLQQALSQTQDEKLLRALFSFQVDPNQTTSNGTALQAAIAGDNLLGVQLLLSAGADADTTGRGGLNALQSALATGALSHKNTYKIVDSLLNSGADPNLHSKRTYPPLLLAASLGENDDKLAAALVTRLREAGAKTDIKLNIQGKDIPFDALVRTLKGAKTKQALEG